jgi:hypothetical protein
MRGTVAAGNEVFAPIAGICGVARNSVRFAGIPVAAPCPEEFLSGCRVTAR